MVCLSCGPTCCKVRKSPNKNKNKILKQLSMRWISINMLNTRENQNLCIQVAKVGSDRIDGKNHLSPSSLCTDLTPPISGDLADKFRQTVILVSDQAAPVSSKGRNGRREETFPRLVLVSRTAAIIVQRLDHSSI